MKAFRKLIEGKTLDKTQSKPSQANHLCEMTPDMQTSPIDEQANESHLHTDQLPEEEYLDQQDIFQELENSPSSENATQQVENSLLVKKGNSGYESADAQISDDESCSSVSEEPTSAVPRTSSKDDRAVNDHVMFKSVPYSLQMKKPGHVNISNGGAPPKVQSVQLNKQNNVQKNQYGKSRNQYMYVVKQNQTMNDCQSKAMLTQNLPQNLSIWKQSSHNEKNEIEFNEAQKPPIIRQQENQQIKNFNQQTVLTPQKNSILSKNEKNFSEFIDDRKDKYCPQVEDPKSLDVKIENEKQLINGQQHEGFIQVNLNQLQNSGLRDNTIQSNQEELGSNDSQTLGIYTDEIYNGLMQYASQETISDEQDPEAEYEEFQQILRSGSTESNLFGSSGQQEGKTHNIVSQTSNGNILTMQCTDGVTVEEEDIFDIQQPPSNPQQNDNDQHFLRRLLYNTLGFNRKENDNRFSDVINVHDQTKESHEQIKFQDDQIVQQPGDLEPLHLQTQGCSNEDKLFMHPLIFKNVNSASLLPLSQGDLIQQSINVSQNQSMVKGPESTQIDLTKPSKILEIIGDGKQEFEREALEKFGKIQYLDNHKIDKEVLIVKFYKIDDAIRACEQLQIDGYQIKYVPTKHISDEVNQFAIKTETDDQDARDARLTLNLFKIKENSQIVDIEPEQFFSLTQNAHVQLQQDEVENVFLPRSNDSQSIIKDENQLQFENTNLELTSRSAEHHHQQQIGSYRPVKNVNEKNLYLQTNLASSLEGYQKYNSETNLFHQEQQSLFIQVEHPIQNNFMNNSSGSGNPFMQAASNIEHAQQSQYSPTNQQYRYVYHQDQLSSAGNETMQQQTDFQHNQMALQNNRMSTVSNSTLSQGYMSSPQGNQNFAFSMAPKQLGMQGGQQPFPMEIMNHQTHLIEQQQQIVTHSPQGGQQQQQHGYNGMRGGSQKQFMNVYDQCQNSHQYAQRAQQQSPTYKQQQQNHQQQMSHQQAPNCNQREIRDATHYTLDITDILLGKDNRTTIMIKNIPNKYTQQMLLESIDQYQGGHYDFFYLPIDFKNKCNMGYAFINFIDPVYVAHFYHQFNGQRWQCFNSDKICQITYGRIQGKQALTKNFSNMNTSLERGTKVKPLILNPNFPSNNEVEKYRNYIRNYNRI